MSQYVRYWYEDKEYCRELPDAQETVMLGVQWGSFTNIFTPAYWLSQFWMNGYDYKAEKKKEIEPISLVEETVFCLLGGHGISAEMATAVFYACKKNNLISKMEESEEVWAYHLNQKFMVNDKYVSYRFPKQKAKYISEAMPNLKNIDTGKRGRDLRDNLLNIKGVGPKTAGWIVRNCYGADDVAIIDIHIQRAGQLCGFFEPFWTPEKHYSRMEDAFLEFCGQLHVKPSLFDCLIWEQMRKIGTLALDSIKRVVREPSKKYYRPQPISSRYHTS